MAEWRCTEPGVLALLGSSISVRLSTKAGVFDLYIGEQLVGKHSSLDDAKAHGNRRFRELVEIGAAEDV